MPLDVETLLARHPAPGRSCGECTACCTVLAVWELEKPMRRACDHLCRDGCGIYADRPFTCAQFNCLWLRGALPADVSYRPDYLGVIFDAVKHTDQNRLQVSALEVFPDAFERPQAKPLLDELSREYELTLSFRDGTWETRMPPKSELS